MTARTRESFDFVSLGKRFGLMASS